MDFDDSEIRAALAGIHASGPFVQSARMRRFLSFVVEKALAGQSEYPVSYTHLDVYKRQVGHRQLADFSDVVGGWIPDPAFDEIMSAQRQIDWDKWK